VLQRAACLPSRLQPRQPATAPRQALHLPAKLLPVTMAADNLAMCLVLGALMACPLRLVRRFIAPDEEAAAAAGGGKPRPATPGGGASPRRAGSRGGSGGGSPATPGSPAPGSPRQPHTPGGEEGSGMAITDLQAVLQRQVTVPARMSGKPMARDGGLLLTEEPDAATVWAAYQRSREREAYGPAPGSAASNGNGAAHHGADGGGSDGGNGAPRAAPIVPPDFSDMPSPSSAPGSRAGSGSDSDGGSGLGPFAGGPRARDGGPLLTAEPSPISLQAAYARSRDASRDSGDYSGGGSGGASDLDDDEAADANAAGPRLTPASAAASLVAACAVCAAARAAVAAAGVPQLFLLGVSVLALSASAAGGLRGGGGAFAGASRLGSPLMGLFFTTVGATSAAAGVPLGSIASLLAFVLLMVAIHWVILLAAARALRLEPSTLLVASNTLVGGPATAAGMATSRGWGRLVQPAMLAGSLSYGLGSPAGLGLGLALTHIYG
jgi:hypothetical protein